MVDVHGLWLFLAGRLLGSSGWLWVSGASLMPVIWFDRAVS
jgi:hypothetical protein